MPPAVFRPDKREVARTVGAGFLERYTAAHGDLPVIHLRGAATEMGRQYGALVGDSIRRNSDRLAGLFTGLGLPGTLVNLFLDNAWKRLEPYAPSRYIEEMAAIADGAQRAGFSVTVEDIQRITAVTNLDMYKREQRFLEIVGPKALESLDESTRQALIALTESPGISCTMFAVWGSRTVDGKCFSARNLDWVSQTGIHADRLLTVCHPTGRHAFVSMGYAGVIGCLAGMSERGITLSEVGAFSVREELDGAPWIFTARRVLEESDTLDDAVRIITGAKHTIGCHHLVADGDPAHFGTPGFRPRAAAFETNHACCEVFYDDDSQEHAAVWTDADGRQHSYGVPLPEAVMRADTAFGKKTRALQATDDGPGDPANTGNPCGRDNKGSTFTTCHLPMYHMIRAYETGAEYVFPVRNIKVIEAGAPRKIGAEEALTIAATVAHGVEKLPENDWDVMSVVYAPTDLEFWVAYESRDASGAWRNAPDSGYWQFNLKELLAVSTPQHC